MEGFSAQFTTSTQMLHDAFFHEFDFPSSGADKPIKKTITHSGWLSKRWTETVGLHFPAERTLVSEELVSDQAF